ncbi:hypothetical protein [Human papillomavirus 122]|uniref:Uncharacterized protein E4 n=1 Tax=Human papillomavirus 122 TaxID=765054 RepID=D7P184_9PAPI|nr:hypothetical protein [Human papillomavirus 122]
MLPDLAKLTNGKFMLTRTLCLPLSLALRHLLETGEKPPATPFPGAGRTLRSSLPPPCPPSSNGHSPQHPDGTDEKPLAPPPRGRKDKDKKPLQGDQGPDQGVEQPPRGEGEVEGHPRQTPTAPPGGEGEGEVEGGPQQGPNPVPDPDPGRDPKPEGLLPGVALRLHQWEQAFDRLVESIMDDLNGYWQRLKTPQ